MNLSELIYQHVKDLPIKLQQEVYDFVLFLKQKQQHAEELNNEVIELSVAQQEKFVQALLNPSSANAKLQHSAKKRNRVIFGNLKGAFEVPENFDDWSSDFFEQTVGCFADAPLERGSQADCEQTVPPFVKGG